MRGDLLLDGRNLFDPAQVRQAGLRYHGIGRWRDSDVSKASKPTSLPEMPSPV